MLWGCSWTNAGRDDEALVTVFLSAVAAVAEAATSAPGHPSLRFETDQARPGQALVLSGRYKVCKIV